MATTDIPHIRSDHARLLPAAPYLAAVPCKGKGTTRLQTATYLIVDFFETVRDNLRWGPVLVLQRLCYLLSRGGEFRQADRPVAQLRDWGFREDGGVRGRDVVSRAIGRDESVKPPSGVVMGECVRTSLVISRVVLGFQTQQLLRFSDGYTWELTTNSVCAWRCPL